ITERARACLDAAGYGGVSVVLADAEAGVPERAPYDRIVVTAGAWDIPPARISQLRAECLLVVPVRLRGLTPSVAFVGGRDGLVSRDYCLARFVPMQGDGAYDERKAMLGDGIVIQTDDPDVGLDPDALREALRSPRLERWSGAAWDSPQSIPQGSRTTPIY